MRLPVFSPTVVKSASPSELCAAPPAMFGRSTRTKGLALDRPCARWFMPIGNLNRMPPVHHDGVSVHQSIPREPWRYLTLLLVLMLHGLLISVLVMISRAGFPPISMAHPVELLVLRPVSLPKIRSESAPAQRLTGGMVTAIPPAALDSPLISSSPASSSDGTGSGVDWKAEARRAVQAYEIRSHRSPRNTSVSGDSGEEWLRQLQHHAGDRTRTPNGDWIIWISANCYQVATAGPSMYVAGVTPPPIVCLEHAATDGR
jgi:hypothetical protein